MAKKYTAILVPETHWDRAWSSSFQQSRISLVRLFDKLIKILNDNPRYKNFTFDGQSVIIEDYLEIRPEMERELKRLIQDNRVLVGPWYTLPDEFLVSPEALIRNLMIGHMVAEKFGNAMKVGYVPDSFGHISQLPQILQGFDIDSAVFTRGMGDDGETLGSEFLWYAPDGKTSVLAIHQIGGYCNAASLGYVNGELDLDNAVERCHRLTDMLKPYATTSNLLFNNGCDLLEPQPELSDIIQYVNEKLDDVELIHGTFTDYLELVRAEKPKLKKYQGELRNGRYQFILSGVLSSRMYIRQANEAAQTLMERWVEPFSALSWLETGKSFPRAFLWYAWKELIKNHPYNDICGCSSDEVHRDDMIRYSWVRQIGEEITREALQSIADSIDTRFKIQDTRYKTQDARQETNLKSYVLSLESSQAFVVFNPLPWHRLDAVSTLIPLSRIPENLIIKNASGETIPSQIIQNHEDMAEVVFLGHIPALGYSTYFMDSGEAKFEPAEIRPRTIENRYFRIKINPNGSLNILDKSTGVVYKDCNVYEDTEDAGDEYDYSPIKNSKTITSRSASAKVRIIENGPVRTTAEIRLSMNLPKGLTKDRASRASARLSCSITTKVTIYSDIPRIDFSITFENKIEDHRLRVIFPTDIKTNSVNVEGHFYVLTRSVSVHKPRGKWAQDLLPTNHQNAFLDINDGERGFAVINKGLPEYEIRKTKTGCNIYLTLLRCVGWLSRGDLLTRRGSAGVNMPTPEAQCSGIHTFLYSILPHVGDWVSAQVQRRAHEHNVPTRVISTQEHEGHHLPLIQSFISVEPHNLMVTALKKCELGHGLILRFYNSTSEMVNGIIKTNCHIKAAHLTNLNEQPLPGGEIGVREDGTISLEVDGHEIKTVMLTAE